MKKLLVILTFPFLIGGCVEEIKTPPKDINQEIGLEDSYFLLQDTLGEPLLYIRLSDAGIVYKKMDSIYNIDRNLYKSMIVNIVVEGKRDSLIFKHK